MAYSSNRNKKVNTQYLQDIGETFLKSRSTGQTVDIVTFAEAPWGLNVKLFPVQKFILKSFYGMELDGVQKVIPLSDEMNTREIGKFTESEFMDYLIDTGRTNIKRYEPGRSRRELILSVGRRGSKSSITGFISNYEIYRLMKMGNPQSYFGFPDGSEICVCTTAPTIETASTLFTTIKNYCMNCNYLKDKIVNKSQTSLTLCTDHDKEKEADPTIHLVCGGAGSADIRGRSNIVVIMDEAAFFNGSGANSGDNLYQALTPSILSFTHEDEDGNRRGEGKVILISSPFGKSGVFYKKYLDSFEFPDSTLMFNMYTSMVNPTVDGSFLRDEKKRNPDLFNCEYGAKFSDTVSSWINEETLSKVIDRKRAVKPKQGMHGVEYFMGIDYAGKTDGAAISIVHSDSERLYLDYADVYYGGQSDVWWDNHNRMYDTVNDRFKGFEIIPIDGFADEIERLAGLFPVKYGWFDQFNGYALLEILKQRGLHQFDMKSLNAGLNTQLYQTAKELISSELIVLPDHPILIPEIMTLEETKSGNRIIVEAPNRVGMHDDITDAFVISINALRECRGKHKPNAASLGYSSNPSLANGRGYTSYQMSKVKRHGIQPGRWLL